MGEYDHSFKVMVDVDPAAMAQFILQQLRMVHGPALAGIDLTSVASIEQLDPVFQGTEAEADGLLLVTTASGQRYMIHIEFQSSRHGRMPDRLIDYCIRAREKHGPLPMISCVIYVRPDGSLQESPETWNFFELETMRFRYLSLKLWEIPREEVLALQEPALLPISWLTKGVVNGSYTLSNQASFTECV